MPEFPFKATYDDALLLHDGVAAITADGGGVVDAAAKILDLGEGFVDAVLVVDVSAIDVVGGDERYAIHLQGSTVAGMATEKVGLALKELGDDTLILADADAGVGRHLIPFMNVDELGQIQRYVRVFVDCTGATASITFKAYIVKR